MKERKTRRSHSVPHPGQTHQSTLRRYNMTDSTWPNEPHRRKTVLVLNQTDIDALHFEKKGPELLLNEEVYILPFSSKQSNSVVQGLFDSGLARSGAVLIQSPFNKDVYEDSKQAVERFALDKHQHFSTLCGLLGARKVTVEQFEHKNTEDKTTFSVEGNVLMRGVEGKVKNEELTSFRNRLQLRYTFKGGSPNVPAAKKLLKQKGLLTDPSMGSLLEMCQSLNNQIESHSLKLDITSEVQRNLNVLARLDIPAFLSLEAGYDRHVREQTEFTLTIKVEF